MKKSMYTRTALASLLTLCSFSGFAADIPGESLREIKKQESIESIKTKKVDGSVTTSEKREVMKTSNKKLKEKVDRICNVDLKKRAEELKKKEEIKLAAEQKKKAEEMKLVAEQKKKAEEMKLANEKKAKLKNDKAKLKDAKAEKDKVSARNTKIETKGGKDLKKDAKAEKGKITVNTKDLKSQVLKPTVNKSVESKGKINPVVSVGGVDIVDTNQGKSGLRITFGGVVDTQGYGKVGTSGDVMSGKSDAYANAQDQRAGANPLFPKGTKNIGDYSRTIDMVADAILHLRAENKNEDLGLLYGADVQFQVPVTEGKGASQGVYAARGRSAHVFINSEYGDVKLGYQFGPESLMRLDATRIATVDGAADSDWFRKVNLEGSAASFPFYVAPRLYTESFSSESEKFSFYMAGKYNKAVMNSLPFRIAYYSPKYMGARFGLSYSPGYNTNLSSVKEIAPETTHAKDSSPETKHKEVIRHVGPDYEHIFSAGASYEYDLYEYKIKVKAAAVGEYGQAKQPNKNKDGYSEYVEYNDLMGINFGVNADYKIDEDQFVKFGASLAYLGKSGQSKDIKKWNSSKSEYESIPATGNPDSPRIVGLKAQFEGDGKNTMYWTAGAGYQYENAYTSLTYFGSTMNDGDKLHDIALGVQYDLSPACSKSKFVPYLAAHYFWTEEKGNEIKLGGDKTITPKPNKGALILTGVKFSF